MIFDIEISNDKKIRNFYEDAIRKLISFYEINWTRNTPKVFLIPDRKTFDKLYGKETDAWVVGTTMGSSHNIYLLSPDTYSIESSHTYSDREFSALLTHEMSHLFTRAIYNGFVPVWLLEGIAIYSSEQLRAERKPKEFKDFISYYNKGGSGVYAESGYAIEILIKEFGKRRLLDFLKLLNGKDSVEDFKKKFENYFGVELEYNWFNKKL